jgi:hypothetical protein
MMINVLDNAPSSAQDAKVLGDDENQIPTTYEDNPLIKVGVFMYSGAVVGGGFEPNEMVPVYRPAEELSDPECIKSANNKAIIEDHTMISKNYEPGTRLPDDVPVEGWTDSVSYFDGTYIRDTLIPHSQNFDNLMAAGKKQLSAGYYCVYDIASGVFNGQPYKAIQRKIRFNHFAIVLEGRNGPDVAVFDSLNFTCDNAGWEKMIDEKKDMAKDEDGDNSIDLDALVAKLLPKLLEKMNSKVEEAVEEATAEDESDDETKKKDDDKSDKKDAKDSDSKSVKPGVTGIDEDADKEKSDKKSKGEDSKVTIKAMLKEFSRRDELVQQLKPHIGVFDSAEMLYDDVVSKAVKELKLNPAKGEEAATLRGYLLGLGSGRTSANDSAQAFSAQNHANKDGWFNKISGGK